MGTLLGLAQRLEKKIERIEEDANQRSIRVGIGILEDLVNVTPVDTSKALSNWQVGIGARPQRDIPAYVFGMFGSTREASASQAILRGTTALKSKKPGQTIYISNLTPYIGDLDRGSSRQFAGNFKARARLLARKLVGQSGVGFR